MKLIPLTRGYHAIVDDEDYEKVADFKWYAHITNKSIYAARISRRDQSGTRHTIMMHRFILGLKHYSPDSQVDHVNGDGLDNRKNNLRMANGSQNCANKKSSAGKSQFKGVYLLGGKWAAQITQNRKIIYLGRYGSEMEAAAVYDSKDKELFGEFARTNF